jgi:hypothetical protein
MSDNNVVDIRKFKQMKVTQKLLKDISLLKKAIQGFITVTMPLRNYKKVQEIHSQLHKHLEDLTRIEKDVKYKSSLNALGVSDDK